MEPIWKGKQTNKTSNMCTGDKGKQTNKQAEVAHAEVQMQGAVWSCITCRVQYAMCQSMWKSFGDASEMCQKSAEFNTQGHTLTAAPSSAICCPRSLSGTQINDVAGLSPFSRIEGMKNVTVLPAPVAAVDMTMCHS